MLKDLNKCFLCRCDVAVNILISLLAAWSSLNQSVLLKTVQKLSLEGCTAPTLGEGQNVVFAGELTQRAQSFLGDGFISFNGCLQFAINKYSWTGRRNKQLLLNGSLWFSTRPACRVVPKGRSHPWGPNEVKEEKNKTYILLVSTSAIILKYQNKPNLLLCR